ncbi:hypothetical protein [Tautonia marina]|uniref:hypothetical protein n=1 Tax=Tautonia marina TaxID=2653855 RepID=UPI00126123BC|nr:hypothetical protein [Tautonia marina]
MPKDQAQIEREILAEIGERRAAGLKANACSRVCGVLIRQGSDWDKAFEHISDHFRKNPDKPSHLLFHKKYRTKEALRQLLLRAASGPSEIKVTKLKVHGDHLGKPAIEIVREFREPIGESPSYTRLRIFLDVQGNLITAYPGEA